MTQQTKNFIDKLFISAYDNKAFESPLNPFESLQIPLSFKGDFFIKVICMYISVKNGHFSFFTRKSIHVNNLDILTLSSILRTTK